MNKSERRIQSEILAAIGSLPDVRVWRNETAGVWVGRVIEERNRYVVLADAHRMLAGLCKGSADLIGIGPGGRLLAIEVKAGRGRETDEQKSFLRLVNSLGGIAAVCRSADDALQLIEHARRQG